MSQENFETLRESISAVPTEEVKLPNMPVSEAIQEAENLHQWVLTDKEVLEQAGLDWQWVTDLPVRAGACRYAQAIWQRDAQTREDAQKEWSEKSDQAFDLRDVLVHHFLHAFRKQSDLVNKVRGIAEGGTNADMLQDLKDLYHLGISNKDLLDAISFDWQSLEQARDWSDELAVILAKANGARFDSNESKILRDKAYSFMKNAADEIRLHGQYAFWRNDDRKRGYSSKYHK